MRKSKTVKVEENDNFKKAEERHKYHKFKQDKRRKQLS